MITGMKELRRMWEGRGLTQTDLARRAGVTQGEISRIEAGTRRPGMDVLMRLGRVLNCKVDDIVPKGELK
jgi:transcriptional regulator with XRE-family HTH domain